MKNKSNLVTVLGTFLMLVGTIIFVYGLVGVFCDLSQRQSEPREVVVDKHKNLIKSKFKDYKPLPTYTGKLCLPELLYPNSYYKPLHVFIYPSKNSCKD